MDEHYVEVLRSTLWHLPVVGVGREWKRGALAGGILDVRGDAVFVGLELHCGGGAGLPDWREFTTLVVTDLQGREKYRLAAAAADADSVAVRSQDPAERCFSPDGSWVAALSSFHPTDGEGRLLLIWRPKDGVRRAVEKTLSFRWTDTPGLVDIETTEGKRRYDVERQTFVDDPR
jgi:hypothetical protein